MIRKVNLFETFRKAMMRNPEAGGKEAFGYFLEAMQAEPEKNLAALAEDYFYRHFAHWQPVEASPGSHVLSPTPALQNRYDKAQERRAESQDHVRREVSRLKGVILMSLPMPNGKNAKDCTGAELVKVGGFWEAVGRKVGARNVLHKRLTEAELHNVRERYFSDKSVARNAPRGAHDVRAAI